MVYEFLQENLLTNPWVTQLNSKTSVPVLQRFLCVLLFYSFCSLCRLKCLSYQKIVYITNSLFSFLQILLEPGVIQDVLAAGSHLQLLELLSLCSHYLIQVRFIFLMIGKLLLQALFQ